MRWIGPGLLLSLIALAGMPASSVSAESRGTPRVVAADGEEVITYPASHALVIGISHYRNGWKDLPGVREDVPAVKEALEAQGFAVETALDLDRAGLEAVMQDFFRRHGYGRGNERERLLVYFAGHGGTVDVRGSPVGFIVPADAPPVNPADTGPFQAGAISMSSILAWTEQVSARHLMFVFDSCFSGTVFRVLREGEAGPPPAVRAWMAQPVQQFITAGRAGQSVPDRSIFRRKFVLGLQGKADRDNDGYISGTELGYFLETEVLNDSSGQQRPQQGKPQGASDGEFLFVLNRPAPVPPPGPSARTLREACLKYSSPYSDDRVGDGVNYEQLDGASVLSACAPALAVNPDDAAVMVNLGRAYNKRENYSEAQRWYRKAADKGDALAMTNIGALYGMGQGVPQDYAEALRWYRKGADKGEVKAMKNIGSFYEEGLGIPQDYAEALRWYRKAADKGDATAMRNIGYFYNLGRGVPTDYAEALRWYRKAADKGDASAITNIGALYGNGQGVPTDYAEALRWYRKAADKGDALAMSNIGAIYHNGQGVPQDYAEALRWYRKAVVAGEKNIVPQNIQLLCQNGYQPAC